MSDLDDRYDAPHGSTAASGSFPAPPLADQPTEVVYPDPPPARYDTEVAPTAVPPASAGRPDPIEEDPLFDDAIWEEGPATQPEYRDTPVVVRRPDSLAALLLLLAGIAAGVSLLVVWVHGGESGLVLVADGFDDVGDVPTLIDQDAWEPLVVVFGGAALFLLALLAFVPAKTHRFLGALALLVSVVVAAGVLVPLADAGWDVHRWAVGGWLTVAVAGLGLLGALKALMTNEKRR
jgi:hypothetical protein